MTPTHRLSASVIALLTAAALVVQFMATARENPAYTPPETLWELARFFTILTNAIVAATFAVMALRNRMAGAAWLGGVTLWISIVAVVYQLLLARRQHGLEAVADLGLHAVCPLLVVVFWFVAAPKQGLRFRTALGWMLWPLVYVLYALARGLIEGGYPYFFIDPNQVGWDGVLRWSAVLCVGFVLAGGLQVGIARLLR